MNEDWQSLRNVFSSGHQNLEFGLRQMIDAIVERDYGGVAAIADDLDRTSGPHVEFEERYVFPAVEQEAGEAYATQLYDDLAELLDTLVELRELQAYDLPSQQTRQRWLANLRRGLKNLNSTLSLFNYLRATSDEEKRRLLERHRSLCRRAHRWSQLHPIHDS